jgi:hypothetical protein
LTLKNKIMLISNFELLVKRIAPLPATAPPPTTAVSRRAVQSYFLSISNLENRTIRVGLKINIANDAGNRTITPANTLCFYDAGSTNNAALSITDITPTGTTDFRTFQTSSFPIKAKNTAIVVLSPNVAPFVTTPNPDLEIRGYIDLVQLRPPSTSPFPSIQVLVPEANVLTTPEHRAIFLDNEYPAFVATPTSAELDFDQTAYALPTASGKSMVTLEALPGFVFDFPPFARLDRIKIAKDNPSFSEQEISDFIQMIDSMTTKK